MTRHRYAYIASPQYILSLHLYQASRAPLQYTCMSLHLQCSYKAVEFYASMLSVTISTAHLRASNLLVPTHEACLKSSISLCRYICPSVVCIRNSIPQIPPNLLNVYSSFDTKPVAHFQSTTPSYYHIIQGINGARVLSNQ